MHLGTASSRVEVENRDGQLKATITGVRLVNDVKDSFFLFLCLYDHENVCFSVCVCVFVHGYFFVLTCTCRNGMCAVMEFDYQNTTTPGRYVFTMQGVCV